MKTKNFIIAMALCGPIFILPGLAQGLYIGVGGGYGFPAAKQTLEIEQNINFSGSSSTYEYKTRGISMGNGINAGLYAGYMFNENIGAELGISYLLGSKNKFTSESKNDQAGYININEHNYSGRMLRLVPTLRMTAGTEKLRPYMKYGLIIGIAGKIYDDRYNKNTNNGTTKVYEENWEYTGELSLGLHGALGVNYMLSDNLGIFAELAGNYQNWAMKKGVMTKKTNDGKDELAALFTNDKEIEFVESYTYVSSQPVNNNEPEKQTKFYMPFSSIGINIGVHLNFGGGETSK
jgi:hypothetical protein